MKRIGAAALAAALAIAIAQSAVSTEAPQVRGLMQQKREHSREILAAVVTSDWMALERHTVALLRLTQDPAWAPLRSPRFAAYSGAFLKATEELLDAARRRDRVAAPRAYMSLTMTCVNCHQDMVGRTPTPEGQPAPAAPSER
jgi:hypothetical protein